MSDTVNMSDDDFLQLPEPDFDVVQATEDDRTDAVVDEATTELAGSDSEDVGEESVEDDLRDREDGGELNNELDAVDDSGEDDDSTSLATTNTDDTDSSVDDKDSTTDEVDADKATSDDSGDDKDVAELSDAEKNWKAITAPFRANNADMTIDTPEEAVKLMKMGVNYHKKMVAMKDDRAHIETLRDNDLLDPSKLNLLIAANKGDPKAIAKLIQDNSINVMDLEVDGASAYVAEDRSVTTSSIDLRDTISSIRGTDTFDRTMDIVGKEWDASSQDAVIGNPKVITTINDHLANGAYEVITNEVNKQRMLREDLNGMNDLQAYIKIGNELQDAGKFNQADKATDVQKPNNVAPKPAPKKTVSPKAAAARKAASAPKQTGKTSVIKDTSKMSDAEFDKYFSSLNH